MRSINPAVDEFERAFWALAPLFKGVKFPQPVIAIQSRGRRRALGWFWHEKWGNESDQGIAEITITAEHLRGPAESIAGILAHEMVHYANQLAGVRDCSSNQYHNKYFKERAESIGLVVTKGSRGWSSTANGPELLERIQALRLDPDAFSLFRKAREKQKAPTKMKKWSCGCTNIRAAVTVEARCLQCGRDFLKWGE
jgi:hypothetical protein